MQTLAGFVVGRRAELPATEIRVELPDGDVLTTLVSRPDRWRPGDPIVLMVHGLCGSAEVSYVARSSRRMFDQGWLTARLNLRNAGSGAGLARKSYHAGQSDDLRATAEELARRYPGSPIAAVGFSMGGNLVLKLAAESADDPVTQLDRVVAVCPPIDLHASARFIGRSSAKLYLWRFLDQLRKLVKQHERIHRDLPRTDLSQVRTLPDFDDAYTARVHGFRDALDYYEQSSSRPVLDRITIPGLILHAADDPFIPVDLFRDLRLASDLELEIWPHGGHLGFFSRDPWMGDRHWMDARLVTWLSDWNQTGRVDNDVHD